MKRAFLVHGWDGDPENHWFPWLKRELEVRGFTVSAPPLPDPLYPKIETWVPALAEAVGKVDQNTFFIGHSIGCQTILRFLKTLPAGQVAGGAILVAGFVEKLTGLTAEEEPIARPWAGTPLDFEKIKSRTRHLAVVLSDNDPWVPVGNNRKSFEEKLGAEVITEHGKGHFRDDDGITELPVILDLIEKWA